MSQERQPCVYILSNTTRSVVYIGVTSDLDRRIREHKNECIEGFSKKYHCHTLVHYEYYETMSEAILREKHLKAWKREWKSELITKHNPWWRDLTS